MVTCQSSELGWEVTVELPADFLSLGRGSISIDTQSCLRSKYRSCNLVLFCSSVNFERKDQYMYNSYMKNALYLAIEANLMLM